MALAPDIVAGVSRRLAEHAGLQLPAWVVEARTTARIAALDTTPQAYVELLGSGRGQAELGELVEAVRVGESSLFRHKPQIAALEELCVPILRARIKKTLKVWSAGCAAGEEPYTLAIVLARALPDFAIEIVATDVSADALELAAHAEFPLESLDDVPEAYRDAFDVDEDRIRVRAEYAGLVTFDQANLLDAVPPRGCDLVWCRNVLIYFSPQARRRALERLLMATAPGGFVFVGYSESLRDVEELEAMRAGDAVVYVRAADNRKTPVPERKTPLPAVRRPPTEPGLRIAEPTPPPTRIADIARDDVLALAGVPDASDLQAQLGERLAIGGLRRLTIDLDGVDMLPDDLVPVLRRGCAAGRAAGVDVVLRCTRPGAKRWLSRNGLDEDAR